MKKGMRNLLMCSVMFVLMLLIVPTTVKAYGLKQTGASQNSIKVSWDAQSNATKYYVYVGESYDKLKLYTTTSPTTTSATIQKLPAGCRRYVKVTYDKASSGNYTCGSSDMVTLPGKVTGVKQDRWYYYAKSFYAVWKKQDGVKGYEYIVRKNTGKKFKQGKVTYNSASLSVGNISNNMIYTVEVRAYTELNGKTYRGPWSTKAYFFTQPQLKSAYVSKNKLVVKWPKVKGATGYNVYVSTKPKKGYKKVKSVGPNTTSVTIKKLSGKKFSPSKKYFVYVATKKKVKGKTYNSGKLYYWNTKNFGSLNYF